jgi:hypothetical protein
MSRGGLEVGGGSTALRDCRKCNQRRVGDWVHACALDEAAWVQASVNAKVETVEELQARRKNLHIGMCALLREDLAHKADEMLSESSVAGDVGSRIKERVLKDFDDQTREHDKRGDEIFNQDKEYKVLSNEAIDGKAYALQKMYLCLESVKTGDSGRRSETILSTTLKNFAIPNFPNFPWKHVVKGAEIDFGEWNAAWIMSETRELIAGALGDNANIRAVVIKGVKLLSEGWATTNLCWQRNAAVQALPATVALTLRHCVFLTSLDLRCNVTHVPSSPPKYDNTSHTHKHTLPPS